MLVPVITEDIMHTSFFNTSPLLKLNQTIIVSAQYADCFRRLSQLSTPFKGDMDLICRPTLHMFGGTQLPCHLQ